MNMKLIVTSIIIGILICGSLTGFAYHQELDLEGKMVRIYQISPEISPTYVVSYSENNQPLTNNPKYSFMNEKEVGQTYLILSSDELIDAITTSDFISWKEQKGFTLELLSTSDNRIQDQQGHDLQQKIRLFLQEYQQQWNIGYLLIIGDVNTIPMRYCYPNPLNHEFDIFNYLSGEVPTDYYYADITYADEESWDKDGDGYYGEFGQDLPDFSAEIAVGRIPISESDRITYTLNKIVNFEQNDQDWKYHALHAGAFFYFENEDNNGRSAMDGAVLSHYIQNDIMTDWSIHRYSEQDGLQPSEYNWDPLSEQHFINDWRTGKYSIVNWQGHGWTNAAARKVWIADDGDGIPEGQEINWPNFITRYSNLDDDYPSIVTAVSCYVGCPEEDPNSIGNLGIDLLTHPSFGAAVAVVASARSPYGSADWPTSPGGSDQIIYEFNKNLITHEMSIGDAFYTSKYYCTSTYGWNEYYEYIDMFTFNLFGDPSMLLITETMNHRPITPDAPDGPDSVKVGNTYDYSVSTTDPEGDKMFYQFDWGEEEPDAPIGPYDSGEKCNISHTWSEKGKTFVMVKAIDEHGAESNWSASLPVRISKSKSVDFLWNLIPYFYYLYTLLRIN